MYTNTLDGKKKNKEELDALAEKALQTSIDTGKAVADISADERFYNRSVRIRKRVMMWMVEHIDEKFDSMGEMEAQAANYARCSMPCSRRWIFQFTQPDKPFWIEEETDFYILRQRPGAVR